MASNAAPSVRKLYRELLSYAANEGQRVDVRSAFRKTLGNEETVESRLKAAEKKLAFLRISSAKPTRKKTDQGASGKWVYKNGERLEHVEGTLRDASGRIVSSYDGTNLDPESVSRHRKGLKRAGFANNLHAKGFF